MFERTVLRSGTRLVAFHGSRCPKCADEREQSTSPRTERARHVMENLGRVGVNTRKYADATLDSFDAAGSDTPVRAAREFVRASLDAGRHAPVRGLNLCGADTGVGKTHLAVAILREHLLDPRVAVARCVFDRADRLITEIRDTYGTGQMARALKRRETAHLWVLDDLGAEQPGSDVLRVFTDLFSAREAHPTVVTSNFTPSDLVARFKESGGARRLASRLGSQNFRTVMVKGYDRRFEKAV